ncbi:Lsr2 family protein [Curtobacterium sp. MCSS17_007]|uniref:histone-like nucleoid-structuring protein Lsr2 n=1 Tax=Curtobacterium sp. MCSS17_007 TaxID=2175646 RepID=UPI000DA795FA|nr:Lsr2 family protein [Curtobacterium sp. MCSS17_007]WIE74471.1 Lsr2 family protein [Curtobacterium sp. MCSS17_007]
MAQKVTTTLIDDLDGAPIEDGKGGTVQFGFDGTSYEIDLSDANKDKLRDALSDYVASARRVGRSSGSASKPARNNSEDLTAIREWAAANGHEVSSRGRISQSVKDAYYAANK